jgi:type VI secretion system protein ImpF
MPDPIPAERIQACLLDRLTDENPESQTESRNARILSLQKYREAALRDLRWLLNARAHVSAEEIADFGEAAKSVLTYGLRDLCGTLSSTLDPTKFERELLDAIHQFEPRLIKTALKIRTIATEHSAEPNVIAFELHGELWANPIPEQLYLKTEIDLDTGECRVAS